MAKIRYEKELTGKLVGRGGPRDIQQRQELFRQSDAIRDLVVSGISTQSDISSYGRNLRSLQRTDIDMSQYLCLTDVRNKIDDAVRVTKDECYAQLSDDLKSLNNSLNSAKMELIALNNDNAEKSIKIAKLESELSAKETAYSRTMDVLQEKLDQLYAKISDGSIKPLVGSKMGRPELEDKIFIDPLGPADDSKMDSHIDIKEESMEDSKDRNIVSDVAKLRKLLKP